MSRQLYDNLGSNWQDHLDPKNNNHHNVALLINLFIEHWQVVFRKTLSQSDRAYVSELKEARNKWAHSAPMASEDVNRYLDTAVRLCRNINASEQADAIRAIREELQQQVFSDRARNRTRYQASIENQIQPGLVPWRDVHKEEAGAGSGSRKWIHQPHPATGEVIGVARHLGEVVQQSDGGALRLNLLSRPA